MMWHLIIIVLFWENSPLLCRSLFFPLHFYSGCHSCGFLLLLRTSTNVLVTEWMCEWLRPTRLFAMNCLKAFCPLNAEHVWVLVDFVKCVNVVVHFYVCPWQDLSLMLEVRKGPLNSSAVNWRLSRKRKHRLWNHILFFFHPALSLWFLKDFWKCQCLQKLTNQYMEMFNNFFFSLMYLQKAH